MLPSKAAAIVTAHLNKGQCLKLLVNVFVTNTVNELRLYLPDDSSV